MRGLLGSISLLQIEHLSLPEIAFNPPQLPLIFLPISITPSDINVIITIKNINVIKNISIINFLISLVVNIQFIL